VRQRVQIAAPAAAQAVRAVALMLRTCERRLSGEQSGPLSGCNGSTADIRSRDPVALNLPVAADPHTAAVR